MQRDEEIRGEMKGGEDALPSDSAFSMAKAMFSLAWKEPLEAFL